VKMTVGSPRASVNRPKRRCDDGGVRLSKCKPSNFQLKIKDLSVLLAASFVLYAFLAPRFGGIFSGLSCSLHLWSKYYSHGDEV